MTVVSHSVRYGIKAGKDRYVRRQGHGSGTICAQTIPPASRSRFGVLCRRLAMIPDDQPGGVEGVMSRILRAEASGR
jgi:hypothetical protein